MQDGAIVVDTRNNRIVRAATQLVPDLFARNERVICRFDSQQGPLIMVLVGAMKTRSQARGIATPAEVASRIHAAVSTPWG